MQKHRGWVSDEGIERPFTRYSGDGPGGTGGDRHVLPFDLQKARGQTRHIGLRQRELLGHGIQEAILEKLTAHLGIPMGEPPRTGASPCCPSPVSARVTTRRRSWWTYNLHGDVDPGKIEDILEQYR